MKVRAIRCPGCGETGSVQHVASSLYPPTAPAAFGGPALALVFDRSRKQQFNCHRCGTVFARHSLRSRFFQIFWIWFWIVLAAFVFYLVINLGGM
jgi:hypothetical protein